jgi:hypothetical protein
VDHPCTCRFSVSNKQHRDPRCLFVGFGAGLLPPKARESGAQARRTLVCVWPFDPVLAALPDREVAAAQ